MLTGRNIDLRRTAVLGPDFASVADADVAHIGSIQMTSYSPNELRYHFSSRADKAVVFSEIYYPEGWKMSRMDTGENIDLFRADWTLRGAIMPAGDYDVVMRFEPEIYPLSSSISRVSSILLILLTLIAISCAVTPKSRSV